MVSLLPAYDAYSTGSSRPIVGHFSVNLQTAARGRSRRLKIEKQTIGNAP